VRRCKRLCRAIGASGNTKTPARDLPQQPDMIAIGSWGGIRVLAVATMLLTEVILAAASVECCEPAIEAARYDREADEDDEAAERYRAWALAVDMFATDRYGKARDLAQQAARFEAAARQSRLHAAALRERGRSDRLSCIDESSTDSRASRGEP